MGSYVSDFPPLRIIPALILQIYDIIVLFSRSSWLLMRTFLCLAVMVCRGGWNLTFHLPLGRLPTSGRR
jgi:hypothetical protein